MLSYQTNGTEMLPNELGQVEKVQMSQVSVRSDYKILDSAAQWPTDFFSTSKNCFFRTANREPFQSPNGYWSSPPVVHWSVSSVSSVSVSSVSEWSCAAFQCDCQKAADFYGIHAGHGFGCAPIEAQRWWISERCNNSASVPPCGGDACTVSNSCVTPACTGSDYQVSRLQVCNN
jgi:hypothetical protein